MFYHMHSLFIVLKHEQLNTETKKVTHTRTDAPITLIPKESGGAHNLTSIGRVDPGTLARVERCCQAFNMSEEKCEQVKPLLTIA